MFTLTLALLAAAPQPKLSVEVDRLKQELVSLKQENEALRGRLESLEKLEARLSKIEQRVAAEDERRDNLVQVRATVEAVVQQLRSGDKKGVDQRLAESVKLAPPDVARFLVTAREALARDDLANGRAVLTLWLATTTP